jgi:glycerol uptake facilitator protein
MQKNTIKFIRTENVYARILLSEMLGTFILVSCGLGSVAQNTFNSQDNPILGSALSINLAFAFSATVAIVVCGRTSGAHLNPAVSFCLFLKGNLTAPKMLVSMLGQMVGAFLAACAVFLAYLDSFRAYKDGMYR